MGTPGTARADLARPRLDAAATDSRAPPGFWSAITIATTCPVSEATVEDTAEIVVGGEVAFEHAHDMARRFVVRADGRVLAGIPEPRWT